MLKTLILTKMHPVSSRYKKVYSLSRCRWNTPVSPASYDNKDIIIQYIPHKEKKVSEREKGGDLYGCLAELRGKGWNQF
jgi:hypothetical protein